MTTAAVIGSGSAGRRHALALRRALPHADIVVVRRPDSDQPIDVLHTSGIRILRSIDEVDADLVAGVVASPATMHVASVEALASRTTALLLEKPVAASLEDAVAIDEIVATYRLAASVGYHLRCTDTFVRLRDLLRQDVVGELSRFDLSMGQHLRLWRPAVDASRSVSARTELGGGVLNELSHEIDAVRHLLGDFTAVSATLRHDGAPSDGIVDTVADLQVRTAGNLTGTVHLDMVSNPARRHWCFTGNRGMLQADLLSGRIEVRTRTGTEVVVDAAQPGERDRAEDRLIANLLSLADGAEPVCTLDDGVAVVAVIAAARRSAERGGTAEVTLTPSSSGTIAVGAP